MSSDSTNSPLTHGQPTRQLSKAYRFLTVIATTFIGLALYIVPPLIATIWLGIAAVTTGLVQADDIERWFEEEALAQFLFFLITEILVVAVLIVLMRGLKETWHSIGVRRPQLKHTLYALGTFVLYYATFIAVAGLLSFILPLDFDQEQELGFDPASTVGFGLVLAFISLVILPPLAEEVLFRGFLYTRFRRALPVIWSALILSLLFAAAHLQFGLGNGLLWVAALDTFILSLFLVGLREKTGTIWAGVGVHALKNLLAFVVLFELISIPGV